MDLVVHLYRMVRMILLISKTTNRQFQFDVKKIRLECVVIVVVGSVEF